MSSEWTTILAMKAKMHAIIAGNHAQENNDEDGSKKMEAGMCW